MCLETNPRDERHPSALRPVARVFPSPLPFPSSNERCAKRKTTNKNGRRTEPSIRPSERQGRDRDYAKGAGVSRTSTSSARCTCRSCIRYIPAVICRVIASARARARVIFTVERSSTGDLRGALGGDGQRDSAAYPPKLYRISMEERTRRHRHGKRRSYHLRVNYGVETGNVSRARAYTFGGRHAW